MLYWESRNSARNEYMTQLSCLHWQHQAFSCVGLWQYFWSDHIYIFTVCTAHTTMAATVVPILIILAKSYITFRGKTVVPILEYFGKNFSWKEHCFLSLLYYGRGGVMAGGGAGSRGAVTNIAIVSCTGTGPKIPPSPQSRVCRTQNGSTEHH